MASALPSIFIAPRSAKITVSRPSSPVAFEASRFLLLGLDFLSIFGFIALEEALGEEETLARSITDVCRCDRLKVLPSRVPELTASTIGSKGAL